MIYINNEKDISCLFNIEVINPANTDPLVPKCDLTTGFSLKIAPESEEIIILRRKVKKNDLKDDELKIKESFQVLKSKKAD